MQKLIIKRPGDLESKGIRSTIKGNFTRFEVFDALCVLQNEIAKSKLK